MSRILNPGVVVHATALELVHEPLPAGQVVAGAATTAWVELGPYAGTEIGVWEMTPGAATDVEIDEVFVVLIGRARVEFTEPGFPTIELAAGDVMRLSAGMRTIWTVTETLRKISIA